MRTSLAAFDEIVRSAVAVTGADMGNLQLLDPASGALRIVASHGFGNGFLDFFAVVRDEESACGAALRRGARIIVANVAASPIFAGTASREVVLESGVRSVQSTPVLGRSGRVIGMLSTHRRIIGRPGEEELLWLDRVARQAADAVEAVAGEAGSARPLRAGTTASERGGALLRRSEELIRKSRALVDGSGRARGGASGADTPGIVRAKEA